MSEINTDWVTVAEAARLLGVTRQRVWQLAHRGKLDTLHLSAKLLLISRRSVVARLAEKNKSGRPQKMLDAGK